LTERKKADKSVIVMSEPEKFIDQDLLDQIDAFLTSTGMSATAFGLKVTNDRRLIPDLREGRDLRGTTRRKILEFIAAPPPPAGQNDGEAAA